MMAWQIDGWVLQPDWMKQISRKRTVSRREGGTHRLLVAHPFKGTSQSGPAHLALIYALQVAGPCFPFFQYFDAFGCN